VVLGGWASKNENRYSLLAWWEWDFKSISVWGMGRILRRRQLSATAKAQQPGNFGMSVTEQLIDKRFCLFALIGLPVAGGNPIGAANQEGDTFINYHRVPAFSFKQGFFRVKQTQQAHRH
jgi:hypothetical protein